MQKNTQKVYEKMSKIAVAGCFTFHFANYILKSLICQNGENNGGKNIVKNETTGINSEKTDCAIYTAQSVLRLL